MSRVRYFSTLEHKDSIADSFSVSVELSFRISAILHVRRKQVQVNEVTDFYFHPLAISSLKARYVWGFLG